MDVLPRAHKVEPLYSTEPFRLYARKRKFNSLLDVTAAQDQRQERDRMVVRVRLGVWTVDEVHHDSAPWGVGQE